MPIAIESLEGGSSNKISPGEFFNHVFNFDSDNKANMLNLIQYILIGIIEELEVHILQQYTSNISARV